MLIAWHELLCRKLRASIANFFCVQMIQKVRVNQGQMYFHQTFFGIFGYNGPDAFKLRPMENLVMIVQNGSP